MTDEEFRWRLQALEELVRAFGPVVGQVARDSAEIENLKQGIDKLAEAQARNNRLLLSLALTIAGSSVTVLLSVLVATGQV